MYKRAGPVSRRFVLRGVSAISALAAPMLASPAYAQVAPAATRTRAVLRLRTFFASTLGESTAERLRLANAALAGADPFDASSLLVEIAAIGVIVRAQPVQDSVRARYPSRSKSAIDRANAAFPDTPWVNALCGAWHFEVVRRSSFGAMMLGANRDAGRELFARAIAAPGGDQGLRVAYAISLLSEPSGTDVATATETLSAAPTDAEPSDAPEAYRATVRQHADQLRELLRTRSVSQVQSYVLQSY